MFCAKINADCPHRVIKDSSYVFVLMPFANSASIFDSIKQAVENLPSKKFTCDRADVKYTSSDIWCQKICRAIRRAKYLIVDTTGLNANVFYELGFAHALGQTKNIIITQNINELPFDVSTFSAIEYSEKNFPKLRADLQKALTDLEAEEPQQMPAPKTPADIIQELKAQIRAEEERSEKFKQQARESEKEIATLKQRIAEIQAIEQNPEAEAKKLIAAKEQEIEKLQHELSQMDQRKKEEMSLLEKQLEEERQVRQQLEHELAKFKQTGDPAKLTRTTSEAKSKDWQTEILNQAKKLRDEEKYDEAIALLSELIQKAPNNQSAYWYRAFCFIELKDYDGAVSDFTSAIELDPKYATAFNNRGLAYAELKDYDRAIADYTQAIALDPKDAQAFYNRGNAYARLQDYDRAIADYTQAIALEPKYISACLNLAELELMAGRPAAAEQAARSAIKLAESTKDRAISNYLLAVSLKIQGKPTATVVKKLEQLCAQEFETGWSFEAFENWLEGAELSPSIKDFIREQTELVKQHRK